MRIWYFAAIVVLFAVQMLFVSGMFRFGERWFHSFVALAHLVPAVGGVAIFYRTGAFAETRRPIYRIIALSLVFGVASAGAFWLSLFIVFTWLMAFGGHHW